jgi:hypothetical protein
MKHCHLLFLVLLFSCSNTKKIELSKSEFKAYNEKMYSFFGIKANANFGFQFNKPINNSVDTSGGSLIFQGGYFDENEKSLTGGTVLLGERVKNINIRTQNGLDTIIDKKIIGTNQLFSFQFPNKDSGVIEQLTTEKVFYIPKLLKFTSKSPEGDIENFIIKVGDTFTWEPDINNDRKEIIVGVEYKSIGLFNEKFKKSNPKNVSHAIVIEDKGTFTFTDNLFQNIPKDATVNIIFSRRNYKEFIVNSKKYVLYASYYYYGDYKLK